jgi:hypothetical protein
MAQELFPLFHSKVKQQLLSQLPQSKETLSTRIHKRKHPANLGGGLAAA